MSLFLIRCREAKQVLLEAPSLIGRFDILSLLFKNGWHKVPNLDPFNIDILRSLITVEKDKTSSSGSAH